MWPAQSCATVSPQAQTCEAWLAVELRHIYPSWFKHVGDTPIEIAQARQILISIVQDAIRRASPEKFVKMANVYERAMRHLTAVYKGQLPDELAAELKPPGPESSVIPTEPLEASLHAYLQDAHPYCFDTKPITRAQAQWLMVGLARSALKKCKTIAGILDEVVRSGKGGKKLRIQQERRKAMFDKRLQDLTLVYGGQLPAHLQSELR